MAFSDNGSALWSFEKKKKKKTGKNTHPKTGLKVPRPVAWAVVVFGVRLGAVILQGSHRLSVTKFPDFSRTFPGPDMFFQGP